MAIYWQEQYIGERSESARLVLVFSVDLSSINMVACVNLLVTLVNHKLKALGRDTGVFPAFDKLFSSNGALHTAIGC